MEARTKKILIGSVAVIVIGGVGAYLFWKSKKDKEEQQKAKDDDAKKLLENEIAQKSQSGAPKGTGGAKSKTTNVISSSPISVGKPAVTSASQSAHQFLASGGNIGNKKIYGSINDTPIYSATQEGSLLKIGVAKRGEYLGVAYKAELLPNGKYFIYFMNPNSKASKILSSSVTI